MRISTLIVDDMELSRKRLRRHLKTDADVDIVSECVNGHEAIEAIETLKPDLVFLDVQMPEVDAFELVEKIGVDQMPFVIFITAFDNFAMRAFDVHAVDYLLKPFDTKRLEHALERAKCLIQSKENDNVKNQLRRLLENVDTTHKYLRRLMVKSGGRSIFLHTDEIDWISSASNYVELHVGKQTHLIRERLSILEAKLDPDTFVRVHRTTIVNIERIKELHPLFNGDQQIVLQDNSKLTMSRTYRNNLFSLLGAA